MQQDEPHERVRRESQSSRRRGTKLTEEKGLPMRTGVLRRREQVLSEAGGQNPGHRGAV